MLKHRQTIEGKYKNKYANNNNWRRNLNVQLPHYSPIEAD